MTIEKYNEVLSVLAELIRGSEFEGHVFSVGGCERDRLMGRSIKDIDIVVDIPDGGIKIANWLFAKGCLLKEPVVYEHYGTSMFHLKDIPDIELEAVQTRKEAYRDVNTRNPETAYGTILEDCTRRDFTYNAIYHNISTDEVVDFNGKSLQDLKDNVLRTCGEPDIIFEEDPLRILRGIRFVATLGSSISDETLKGMRGKSERLQIICPERIEEELTKMLTSNNAYVAVDLLIKTSAISFVFRQTKPEVVNTLKKVGSNDLCVNLAVISIYAMNWQNDLQRMRFPNSVIDRVMELRQLFSSFPLNPTMEWIRRFQYQCKNYTTFNDIMLICKVFYPDEAFFVEKITEKMREEGYDMFGYKLPVDGKDVMEIKNLEPSPKVKFYLDLLLRAALFNPKITKDECIKILEYN